MRLPAIATTTKNEGEILRMSTHSIEAELVGIEEVVCNSDPWEARTTLKPTGNLGFRTLNARSVEFIAKPGRIRDLRNSIRGSLIDYLKKQRGFASAIVLTSHKEPRLFLVMSLWQAEKDAIGNRWEDSAAVRKMISPFIDVCSRVHTYEAALPDLPGPKIETSAPPVC